jgi:hypothetical protein
MGILITKWNSVLLGYLTVANLFNKFVTIYEPKCSELSSGLYCRVK